MKKVVFLFLAAVFTASFAQAQIAFGVRAGVSYTGNGQYGGIFDDDKTFPKIGFHIGGVAEFELSNALSIQPGLLLATQGDKVVKKATVGSLFGGNASASIKNKVNMTYIQIPVNVQYKITSGMGDLLIHLGPYFGYAISGKIKNESTLNGKTEKETKDITFGDGYDYKPLDFGLGTGISLGSENYRARIEFNHSLTNISNVSTFTARNWSFVVGMTYLFGK